MPAASCKGCWQRRNHTDIQRHMRCAFFLLSILCLSPLSCTAVGLQPSASPVLPEVENSYRVSPELYRSGQPDEEGFRTIEQAGIKSVLNLREYHSDDDEAAGTRLKLLRYPVAAGSVTEEDILNILNLLRTAPKPVLVHCWHGSDRTGITIAAYRIVEQGVSVEEAEKELTDDRFGHHEFWYGNLRKLLHSTDWNALRNRLNSGGK